jgi:hypothetical protein
MWMGLSIVVAVAATTRGRSPIAWFIYAIIFSPLLSGLLLLALPNLSNSFAAGRMYLEGELREFEERRRRRTIVARIAAVVVVLMGIVAWCKARCVPPRARAFGGEQGASDQGG